MSQKDERSKGLLLLVGDASFGLFLVISAHLSHDSSPLRELLHTKPMELTVGQLFVVATASYVLWHYGKEIPKTVWAGVQAVWEAQEKVGQTYGAIRAMLAFFLFGAFGTLWTGIMPETWLLHQLTKEWVQVLVLVMLGTAYVKLFIRHAQKLNE